MKNPDFLATILCIFLRSPWRKRVNIHYLKKDFFNYFSFFPRTLLFQIPTTGSRYTRLVFGVILKIRRLGFGPESCRTPSCSCPAGWCWWRPRSQSCWPWAGRARPPRISRGSGWRRFSWLRPHAASPLPTRAREKCFKESECCGTGMPIFFHPGSQIPDQNKKKEWEINLFSYLFLSS